LQLTFKFNIHISSHRGIWRYWLINKQTTLARSRKEILTVPQSKTLEKSVDKINFAGLIWVHSKQLHFYSGIIEPLNIFLFYTVSNFYSGLTCNNLPFFSFVPRHRYRKSFIRKVFVL